MTAALTTRFKGSLRGLLRPSVAVGDVCADNTVFSYFELGSGTGAGNANVKYFGRRTLAAGASETLDLTGALVNQFGESITFGAVKALAVRNPSSNDGDITIGGATSNAFDTIFSGTINVPPGGVILIGGSGTGKAVISGSCDNLKVLNRGSASVEYDILVIGTSDGPSVPATTLSLNLASGELDPRLVMTATSLGTMYDSSGYITWRPNNILLNSATLSTQSVTTIASTPYILSFKGTGTVTLSGTSTAGPLVGTGAGNRVHLKFTPTAGTLTLTVSGSVTEAQLEAVTYEASPRAYNATTGSAYYGPRFDYNPAHGQSGPMLLQELSRSNGMGSSNNLPIYRLNSTTVTLSAVLGPDNYTPAYFVSCTGSGGNISNNSAGGTTLFRCASVFLRRKTGTGSILFGAGSSQVDCTSVPSTGWTRYQVNLLGQNGTYSVTSNVVTVVLSNHGFVTGDAVRADFTSGTAADASASPITVVDANTFTFALTTANTSGNVTIYPTCARISMFANGDEVYAWGWQFEFGLGATSYIPTNGASITRTAEVFTIDGANFSAWFTQTGSLTWEGVPVAILPSGGTSTILSISAGASTAWSSCSNLSTNGNLRVDAGTSGASLVPFSGPLVAGALYRIGHSINSSTNAVVAKMNGQTAVTGTVVGLPTPDRIHLGQTGTGTNIGAYWHKSLKFYNQALTAAQIQAIIG